MTREKFLRELENILQCEDALDADSILIGREEWDSLSIMTIITFFDRNFGKSVKFDELAKCRTVKDIIALAAGAIE